ncbi:MAG: 3-methyl-adenine glycosylase constitutive [Pseudomonadota bacterium]|jgi:DNA-3-methyladenine glycosylase I
MSLSIIKHADGKHRCSWCGELPDYIAYHDTEWGWPVADDKRLFEKITLEGFQSGLSWLTILRKRDAFRKAFAGFDFEKVARFTQKDVERLVVDAGIVRHRGKIESAINNAKRVCELLDAEDSLAAFVWRYRPAEKSRPKRITAEVAVTLTQSPESVALSKDLKKRGFSFVGPTTMYAFMQSMGLVNDHLHGCHARDAVEAARKQFQL